MLPQYSNNLSGKSYDTIHGGGQHWTGYLWGPVTLASTSGNATDSNYRIRLGILSANIPLVGADEVRVQFKGYPSAICVITGASIGLNAGSGVFSSTPTRLTFSGANNYNIPNASTVWSDWVPFNWVATNDYLVHVCAIAAASHYYSYTATGSTATWRKSANDLDETMTLGLTGYSALSFHYYVLAVEGR